MIYIGDNPIEFRGKIECGLNREGMRYNLIKLLSLLHDLELVNIDDLGTVLNRAVLIDRKRWNELASGNKE